MRFPVVMNGESIPAECGFATLADLKVVSGWTRLGKASREPAVQDAAEFAGLACKRWRFYRKAGRFASSLRHMFGQPQIEDFFRLNRAAYHRFRAKVESRWALSSLAETGHQG